MLIKYLTDVVTIKRKQISTSNSGISTQTDVVVYDSIFCYIRESKGSVYNSELSAYTKQSTLKMITLPQYTNIKQGDIIYSDYGVHEIQSIPKKNLTPKNKIDSIQFTLKKI